jgi:hypothetical protein
VLLLLLSLATGAFRNADKTDVVVVDVIALGFLLLISSGSGTAIDEGRWDIIDCRFVGLG